MLLKFHLYLVCERRYNALILNVFLKILQFPVWRAAILEFWMMMERPGLCHLITQTYLGKFTNGYLSTTCGSEMAAKKSAWGSNFTPPRLSCEG